MPNFTKKTNGCTKRFKNFKPVFKKRVRRETQNVFLQIYKYPKCGLRVK